MTKDAAALVARIWPEWQIDPAPVCVHSDSEDYAAHSADGAEAEITIYTLPEPDAPRGGISDIPRSLELQALMRGAPHIVSIDDRAVLRDGGGFITHILVRTQRLAPLDAHFADRAPEEADVVRLGIELCQALTALAAQGIVHLDVRAKNVFVSPSGGFMLGGFDIASTVGTLAESPVIRGARSAIAPEVYHEEPVDARADVYSLGLMLHRLMNRQRLPFMSMDKPPIGFEARAAAFRRRMQGEPLPPPIDASDALSAVILRACAFAPAKRYADAGEMQAALEALLSQNRQASAAANPDSPTPSTGGAAIPDEDAPPLPDGDNPPPARVQVHTFGRRKKSPPIKPLIGVLAVLLLIIAMALALFALIK